MPNPPPPLPNPTTAPLPPPGTGASSNYTSRIVCVPATVASTPEVGGWKPSPGDSTVLPCRYTYEAPSKRADRRVDQFTENLTTIVVALPADPGDLIYTNAVIRLLKNPPNDMANYWVFQALGPAINADGQGQQWIFAAVLVTV